MSIAISGNYKRKGGISSATASKIRKKRQSRGASVSFTDDLKLPENNPFGENSVVPMWNEDILFMKKWRRLSSGR